MDRWPDREWCQVQQASGMKLKWSRPRLREQSTVKKGHRQANNICMQMAKAGVTLPMSNGERRICTCPWLGK